MKKGIKLLAVVMSVVACVFVGGCKMNGDEEIVVSVNGAINALGKVEKSGNYILKINTNYDEFNSLKFKLVSAIRMLETKDAYLTIDLRGSTNLTVIPDQAFHGALNLKEVLLPNTITKIGNQAFQDCHSMKSFYIPENVDYIGDYAFASCSKLDNIIFANSTSSWVRLGKGTDEVYSVAGKTGSENAKELSQDVCQLPWQKQ